MKHKQRIISLVAILTIALLFNYNSGIPEPMSVKKLSDEIASGR